MYLSISLFVHWTNGYDIQMNGDMKDTQKFSWKTWKEENIWKT